MHNPDTATKTYFKGLNGLRAIAALGVVVTHTTSIQTYFHHYAVIIFFTLSGFLITYLLLGEQKATATISLKNFYVRRILRIWPLYFFYILLVIVVHTYIIGDGIINAGSLGYYLVFFQNFATAYLRKAPTDMSHFWTIGVEEQFYLFWPFILATVRNKKRFLILFIIIMLAIMTGVKIYTLHTGDIRIYYFLTSLRFDCMAIGALFATLYFEKNAALSQFAASVWVPVIFWLSVLFTCICSYSLFPFYSDEIASLITAAFIINQINRAQKHSTLENGPMNYLGKISYGIYVYHLLIISLLLYIFKTNGILPHHRLMVPAVSAATIIVACISYQFLEKPFLKMKTKYTVVK